MCGRPRALVSVIRAVSPSACETGRVGCGSTPRVASPVHSRRRHRVPTLRLTVERGTRSTMGGELWGTYDEREAARSFKEAVREWRGGDETTSSASSLSVAYATSASNAALRPSDADGDKVHSVAGSVSRGSPTEATGPSSRAASSAARRARRRTRRRGDSNRRRRHHPGEEPRVSVASTCATPSARRRPPPEVASPSAPRRVQSRPARRHPHHRPDRRLPRARREDARLARKSNGRVRRGDDDGWRVEGVRRVRRTGGPSSGRRRGGHRGVGE